MDTSTFIRPLQLLEALGPASHGEDVGAIIVDLAAGGMIRASAHFVDDHYHVDHQPQPDCEIRSDQWQRIVHQGHVSDVWKAGTVRLDGDAKNHLYYLEIIGIRFDEAQVREALAQYGIVLAREAAPHLPAEEQPVLGEAGHDPTAKRTPNKPFAPQHQPVDAIKTVADYWALAGRSMPPLDEVDGMSVDDAAKRIGVGRTTIYQRIADGTLTAKKVGRRTIITTGSIRTLLGIS